MKYPHYQEIPYQNPAQIFSLFCGQNNAIFLDSARLMSQCGRYSFIAIDPFLTLNSKDGKITLNDTQFYGDPFEVLANQLKRYALESHADLPPFQGGAVGFFSYDLYQHLENIVSSQCDDMQFPDLALGFYDLILAFDHEQQRAWIFSSGFPEQDTNQREARAKKRCDEMLVLLQKAKSDLKNPIHGAKINSNFTNQTYCAAVEKVKDYIRAGDIFEANISQRFHALVSNQFDAFELYLKLREMNPATFSAYLVCDDTIIVSASPERFLKLTAGHVETRPIKGTRPRGKNQQEDQAYANELLQSEKDHAENVMIVDLLRNDLSRVCEDHTVQVPQLCGLESYATVHHLVSVVTGKLKSEMTAVDLLRATFPGGSITGAPKIRAMEIIAEIEPTKRGPYCGSVGYIGFNGDMDLSITIRTYAIKNNIVTFQAGGAVVIDSDPLSEYEETLAKAHALHKALIE